MFGALDASEPQPLVAFAADDGVVAELLERFPEREVFWIDGPAITGNGYRFGSAPVSPVGPSKGPRT